MHVYTQNRTRLKTNVSPSTFSLIPKSPIWQVIVIQKYLDRVGGIKAPSFKVNVFRVKIVTVTYRSRDKRSPKLNSEHVYELEGGLNF